MTPDDIPVSVTDRIYSAPFPNRLSQNDVAALLVHFWPAIEAHIREQVAQEIEAHDGPAPWGVLPKGRNGSWIDSRDCAQAAHIARGVFKADRPAESADGCICQHPDGWTNLTGHSAECQIKHITA